MYYKEVVAIFQWFLRGLPESDKCKLRLDQLKSSVR